MVYLTRLEHFNAAHKLYNPGWSKEKNEAVFGKCANENWHGHNYELYVTIKGEPDPDTGFLFDVKQLGEIIRNKVIEKVDHKNLNLDTVYFRDLNPTAENIAAWIWERTKAALPQLAGVVVFETPDCYAEYDGI